ncbi:MAG TPA: NUDIX hydrolase [Anaerolineae bacterium]|nr:NUDIX hydrolase [Anaerolineae bacterium]
MDNKFTPWKTIARRTVLHTPPYLSVEMRTIQLPDGRTIPDWAWIDTPDYINVVAVTRAGEFICFRQTKYAVEGTSLAVVGGYIEPGEDPLAAARRELLEETGYRAERWQSLGSYAVDGNRGAGVAHFFLAQGAEKTAEIDADDLEAQELLLLSRAEVESALARHEFKVLPWAAIVSLALQVSNLNLG